MAEDIKTEEKKELNEVELKGIYGGMTTAPEICCPYCKKRISLNNDICPYCGKNLL